jgi:hypothetical protein
MNKHTYITVEEWQSWRSFDKLRRSWGLREQLPHRGFYGTKTQHTCPCYSCYNPDVLDDAIRVSRHNMVVEAPLKKKFFNQWRQKYGYFGRQEDCKNQWQAFIEPKRAQILKESLGRSAVLNVFVEALSWNPERWNEMLDLMQSNQSKLESMSDRLFLLRLVSTFHMLVNEYRQRYIESMRLKDTIKKGFPKMLRLYETPLNRPQQQKPWKI